MTYVARLRGITVGGAKAPPMKELRGTLGWRDVESCVVFGSPAPDRGLFEARRAEGDGLETGRGVAWLHTPGGFGRSKLAQWLEAVVGCPLTARNLRTVDRLVERLDGRG
ncbi:hypothetical protein JF540_21760 [Salipiger thiooxidans]|uniref:hypothetical protein n=1 Tax=Salipiger thiooxidans TaxID=282683 RepID=UPI001A8C5A4E|nr:hypothetical protein [Salipiger thiooxidans]MBN8189314.1 hypothetical protein [Salipiger thiooxidans]